MKYDLILVKTTYLMKFRDHFAFYVLLSNDK